MDAEEELKKLHDICAAEYDHDGGIMLFDIAATLFLRDAVPSKWRYNPGALGVRFSSRRLDKMLNEFSTWALENFGDELIRRREEAEIQEEAIKHQ